MHDGMDEELYGRTFGWMHTYMNGWMDVDGLDSRGVVESLKVWTYGPKMDGFNYKQQLGRSGGKNVQPNPCYSQGKPLRRMHNTIKTQPMFYPNIITHCMCFT